MERHDYVRRVLETYRATPGTCGVIRRQDRLLAERLHERRVPIESVENAFVLAAARRLVRDANAPPLAPVRSLAYFLPVLDEVLHLDVGADYFEHLRQRLARLTTRK